eukprot:6185150-Pleurochrysis_carterae.AAC.2
MDYGDETVDTVNGIGLRFMSVNPALPAMADDAVDDQGEQTDATLDGIQSSADSAAEMRFNTTIEGEGLPPRTPRPTQEDGAAKRPASARARSSGEMAYLPHLGAHAPNSGTSHTPLPKYWYTITGGHFEGVRFANHNVISE